MFVQGLNSAGQLGDGAASTTMNPVLVADDVVDVSVGYRHTLFLKSNGSLWGMGMNSLGSLGLEVERTDVPLGIMRDVDSIQATFLSSFILDNLGYLWVSGGNFWGEAGVGNDDVVPRFTSLSVAARSVATSYYFSAFVKTDGSLWGMGLNIHGALGMKWDQQDFESAYSPIKIDENVEKVVCGNSHILYLKENGEVWGMGSNYSNQLSPAEDLRFDRSFLIISGVKDIGAGRYNSFIIKEDGSLWGVGLNEEGTLGIGREGRAVNWTYITGDVATVSGTQFNTYIIKTDRSLWGMGRGDFGLLGSNGRKRHLVPVRIMGDVKKVSSAPWGHSTMILKEDGTLWALGANDQGQLGIQIGKNREEPYLLTAEVKQVSLGQRHGFLLKEDGGLWGMGENGEGELGLVHGDEYVTPTYIEGNIQAVEAGRDHTLVLTRDGVLKSTGLNDSGQLGDGTFHTRKQLGVVDTDVVAMAAGNQHSLYLKSDGRLFGMGLNSHGQLGQGDTVNRNRPVLVAENVVALSAGGAHSLFVTEEGTLHGCGSNESWELGLGNVENSLHPVVIAEDVMTVSSGLHHSMFIKSDFSLWGMGGNENASYGRQFGLRYTEAHPLPRELAKSIKAVSAGEEHNLILDCTNTLYGAGYNDYGELAPGSRGRSGWSPINSLVSAFDAGWGTSYYVVSEFWNGWPVQSTGNLYADNKVGWINVENSPWIWVYNLEGYVYLAEQGGGPGWLFVPTAGSLNLGDSWGALTVDADGNANWDAVLGWINVSAYPWIYIYSLGDYGYLSEGSMSASGLWMYKNSGLRNESIPEYPEMRFGEFIPTVEVPGGSFLMGDFFGDGYSDERPVHEVSVSSFLMGLSEITYSQWSEVESIADDFGYTDLADGGYAGGSLRPVHSVNWFDAVKWCNAYSERVGLEPVYLLAQEGAVYRTGEVIPYVDYSKNGYRLPTEAEWEKAARGGLVGKRFPWGDTISHSEANYLSDPYYDYDLSDGGYHPDYADSDDYPDLSGIIDFPENGYGLYGMTGNVWEWCTDWYSNNYYDNSETSDPKGPDEGKVKVIRGGAWNANALAARVARRSGDDPTFRSESIGFRIVRRL